jgi:mannose-6-phosphate isomerase-like protein (cupin superfamily)
MGKPVTFEPAEKVVALSHHFDAALHPAQSDPGIPVNGATFGVADMSENSPHGGERHPDGDEVLYLVSGRVRVVFLDSNEADIEVEPGDGLIVPKGAWHRVDILEPSRIVYLTPGPNNEYRPLEDGA